MSATCACEYCGQEREPMEFMGHIVGHRSCSCKEAQAEAERLRQEEIIREEKEAERRKLDLYRRSGIRKRYITADVECNDLTETVLSGKGLYIFGGLGVGKTYLASVITMRLIDKRKSVRFITSVEALSQIRASYDNGQSEDGVLRKFCACDVLVLDDLGKENQTQSGWAESMVFRIVNERYVDMLPIIITTQFPLSELKHRLSRNAKETGAAIVSRLVEMCRGVHLKGEDRRQASGQ